MFKHNNFKLTLLVAIASVLSILLIQQNVMAAWTPPVEGPPVGESNILTNPLTADFYLSDFKIGDNQDFDGNNNFILHPGGPTGMFIRAQNTGMHVMAENTGIHIETNEGTSIISQGDTSIWTESTCYEHNGCYGIFSQALGEATAIKGLSYDQAIGVEGYAAGNGVAIFGKAAGENSKGIVGKDEGAGSWAGHFNGPRGNVYIKELCLGTEDNCASDFSGNPSPPNYWTLHSNGNDIFNNNTGYVGIGTADPTSILHVYKDDGTGVDNAEIKLQSVAGVNNHWGFYHDRDSDNLTFWRADDLVTFRADGYVSSTAGFCINDDCIDTWAASGTDTDWVEESGDIYRLTGNVGIGLVNHTVNNKLIIQSNGINTDVVRIISNDGDASLVDLSETSGEHGLVDIQNSSGVTTIRLHGGSHSFINNAGNVGIGTNNPSYKLEVAGTVFASSTLIAGDSLVVVNESMLLGDIKPVGMTCGSDQILKRNFDATWRCADDESGGGLWTLHSNGQDIYREDYNVGIGIVDPTYKLHINVDSGEAKLALSSGDRRLAISQGSSGTNAIYDTNNQHEFKTDGAIRAFFGNTVSYFTGNVGIGRDNPSYKLDVEGDVFTNTHLLSDAWYGTTGDGGAPQNLWIGDSDDDIKIQGDLEFGNTENDGDPKLYKDGNSLVIDIGS